MGNPRDPLTFDSTFHIYNHAVGRDRLFREEMNYDYFMSKCVKWIIPVSDLLSYCLVPNHFHLVCRIKSSAELQLLFEKKLSIRSGQLRNINLGPETILEKLVNEQYSHCFNSYAQSYNKFYNRVGSLFKESFQRKLISSDDHLRDVIRYVHNNPVHHGLVQNPGQWKYSSYNDLFTKTPTIIKREEVINIFENLENLVFVHLNPVGVIRRIGSRSKVNCQKFFKGRVRKNAIRVPRE